MIKRLLYQRDHPGRGDGDSDSSSSSSDSDSGPENKYDEEDVESVSEDKENEQSFSAGSGYESEDGSGDEVDSDHSDYQEGSDSQLTGRSNVQGERMKSRTPTKGDLSPTKEVSVQSDFGDWILKSKSVFKCRLCPRIVCLTEDSLKTHLASKRHARSEKLLKEGRLRFMLNSDGEIEEEQETHAERHARTMAVAQHLANKKKKNKGRQRQKQRLMLKRMKTPGEPGKENLKQPTKNAPTELSKESLKQPTKHAAKKRKPNRDLRIGGCDDHKFYEDTNFD